MRKFGIGILMITIVVMGSSCKENAKNEQSKTETGVAGSPREVLEILISAVETDSVAQLASIMPGSWVKDSVVEELTEARELFLKNADLKTLELEAAVIIPSPADKNWMLVGVFGKSSEGVPCLIRIVAENKDGKWFYAGKKAAGSPAIAEKYGLDDPAKVLITVITSVQEGDTLKFESVRFPGDPSLPSLEWHFDSMSKLMEKYVGDLALDYSTVSTEPSHFNKKDVYEAKIKFINSKGENCQIIIEAKKQMTGWYYAGYMASKY